MSNVFLPCMLGNMRFISFTFIKSSFFFLLLLILVPGLSLKNVFTCHQRMYHVVQVEKCAMLDILQNDGD